MVNGYNGPQRGGASASAARGEARGGGGGRARGGRAQRGATVDKGLLRGLAAIARAGTGEAAPDRLSRPAIATMAEICVLNPELFIACGGVTAVTRQLAECATPHMAEALCGVLLHTLNDPVSRAAARIDLTSLSFPYCDFHFRPVASDANKDEREMRFTCSRLALLCVLRSWPGLLHFCHPRNAGGLRAMVSTLYLPRLEVRKAILDLLYELVGLPQPEWTDEISVALDAVDPSDFQDAWRLNEGFIAAEGISILPHLGATGSDITEIHLALLLQCFLEVGLLDGLTEVIVTSDTFISVRATVLVGQLLHLIHLLLPPQVCNVTPALPLLMSQAASGRPQALAAVAALRRLLAIHEARPATHSLFLDHIIQYCGGTYRQRAEDSAKTRKEIDNANLAKPEPILYRDNSIEFLNESDNESETEPKQRHSVGSRADVDTRNVSALVKSKSVSSRTSAAESDTAPIVDLCDSRHKAWVARIINYLRPSANKYSHTDLSTSSTGHAATRAGCQLIRHLLRHHDADSQKLLEDFFADVNRQVEAIETGRRAHECLFSPQHMSNTMCQMYFLFIGQLCHSHHGLSLLKQSGLYNNLLELSTKTHHSCYVKLVVSSLDYSLDSYPRDILAKTLTCSILASRLYATQFLNVLLRASQKSKELLRRRSKLKKNYVQDNLKSSHKVEEASGVDMETWVLQMLVAQIKDESKSVVKSALMILEEAYSVPALFDKLVLQRVALGLNCRLDKTMDPSSLDFSVASDRGYLIWLGLEIAAIGQAPDLKVKAFIKKHLDYWTRSYNYRYVRLVEAGVHEALALSEESGGRLGRARRAARPPPHLLAALARCPPLARHLLPAALPPLANTLQRQTCASEIEIMDTKASLWAVGNAALHPLGLQQLVSQASGEDSVLARIIALAKHCQVFSVRATALYVLGCWLCVRHTRHDQFPIIQDDFYPIPDQKFHNDVTSPERRFQVFDVETSEHSDHTDSAAESTHSEAPKPPTTTNEDVPDHKITFIKEPDKRKSHTLPSQGAAHNRNLMPESRTVDILRDFSYERPGAHRMPIENRLIIGRMNSVDQAHEGRVRNTSESSTSGVSSCDSVLGKYAIPDRVLTLSPIPSSSSLYGMKSGSTSHRPRLSETQRRTSSSRPTYASWRWWTERAHACGCGLQTLQRQTCASEIEIMDTKASLWAVGNAALHPLGLQQLVSQASGEDSVLARIIALAKHCQVFSVRATALYVLGVIGSTYDGANMLADLGWLCVRHTRHDQFPIIQDDFYPIPDQRFHNDVTSPERRFQVFDVETSEHSDHTDSAAESTHSEAPKPPTTTNEDVPDHKITFIKEPDKRKSHTLPSQGAAHNRNLMPESRTVDILRDFSYERPGAHRMPIENRLIIGRMNSVDQAHEGRVRNTSESSTSGVSSCDSVLGKYAIPDRVLTLSPIPSSSSLYGMKSGSTSHRPRLSETQRRTSSSMIERAASRANHLARQLAQLLTDTWFVRPHLSESAASGSSDMDDLSWLLSDTRRRAKPFSSLRDRAKSTRERMAKLSLLDYDWKPLGVSEGGAGPRLSPPPRAPPAPPPPACPPPHYIGICLPRDLADLFPKDFSYNGINGDTNEKDPTKAMKTSILADSSIAGTENKRMSKCVEVDVSSSTDVSSRMSSTATVTSRTAASTDKGSNSAKTVQNSDAKENNVKTIERQNSTASDANASKDETKYLQEASESEASKWRHAANECLVCTRTRPPSSHELREAFFLGLETAPASRTSGGSGGGGAARALGPHAEVLRHVRFMSNPIYLKQTRSALLTLKQKHPEVFRSACVYSDVCAQLARDTYLLVARRFLHELFLDADFSAFMAEPIALLARRVAHTQ
ncbi:hypothetical protein MSG28_007368 [Choristoneura fumiferana]|uniref:Uncharacterized protein n=1 Tax=Choristoneura fumiferana TaxID=7141 RepID=A0ACC0JWV8_CHOFU|nr:hypothetical protein MSG28_007368 [Choristoneura fumiferana]